MLTIKDSFQQVLTVLEEERKLLEKQRLAVEEEIRVQQARLAAIQVQLDQNATAIEHLNYIEKRMPSEDLRAIRSGRVRTALKPAPRKIAAKSANTVEAGSWIKSKNCRVCLSPDAAQINDLILAGTPLKEIAGNYDLKMISLGKHKINHLTSAEAVVEEAAVVEKKSADQRGANRAILKVRLAKKDSPDHSDYRPTTSVKTKNLVHLRTIEDLFGKQEEEKENPKQAFQDLFSSIQTEEPATTISISQS